MPTAPTGKQINPVFAALVESMDEAVGRVLRTLDDLDLSRRTLVVLTSDNGGVCNDNGQIIPATSNAPLRDGMGHLYEGGLRIPLIVKGPGLSSTGQVRQEIVSCMDLFPTILEACSIPKTEPPVPQALDGLSLLPILRGTGPLAREAIYWHFPHYNVNAGARPGAAIRSGEWKLIEFYETGRRELFQLAKDPGESTNLFEKQPEVVAELAGKLDAWRESVGAQRPTENPDYTPNLQHDDGTVILHASTADVFGQMLRYEPLPNKDTLGYWIHQDDWASFEFTIRRPGRFHVIPHVGCGTQGGSLVHFQVAGQTLPLNVPATGHFQNFVPQDLGVVTLEKPGRYTLTIKPQKKEGVAVMDVRQIDLTPVAVAEMLPELHLLEPFWKSAIVYRESVLCVREAADRPATGKLLFPADKILSVRSATGQHEFLDGPDFQLGQDRQQLIRTSASRIPSLHWSDLFMPRGTRPVWTGGPDSAIPCALPHKLGDPETHLLFDNGHWFHDQQIEVTYLRKPQDWPSPVPVFDQSRLPKTIARLRSGQPLKIAVSGDSISYGLNASGLVGAAPFMPMYPELVAAQLQVTSGSKITLVNRAVSGWGVPQGLADLDKLLESQPDLVIIAYGMNDVGRRNPEKFHEGIQEMLSRITVSGPEAEVILVATMLGNDQWAHTPRNVSSISRSIGVTLPARNCDGRYDLTLDRDAQAET